MDTFAISWELSACMCVCGCEVRELLKDFPCPFLYNRIMCLKIWSTGAWMVVWDCWIDCLLEEGILITWLNCFVTVRSLGTDLDLLRRRPMMCLAHTKHTTMSDQKVPTFSCLVKLISQNEILYSLESRYSLYYLFWQYVWIAKDVSVEWEITDDPELPRTVYQLDFRFPFNIIRCLNCSDVFRCPASSVSGVHVA